jgi:hypothetical protein
VCDCDEPDCEDLVLRAEDIVVWELDLAKLGRAVARTLEVDARGADLGVFGARQIGAFGAVAMPVVLVAHPGARGLGGVAAHLVARLKERFVLLGPTSRLFDGECQGLLASVGARFFDLESQLDLMPSGRLAARKKAEQLFAPLLAEATPDRLAAVERFLKGEPLPKVLASGNEAGVATPVETPDPLCCTLRREPACWVLVLQGQRAYLKYEIGLEYVAYLLSHPGQRVSGATLFSKFHPQSPKASGISSVGSPDAGGVTDLADDATLSEENLDKDTERVLEAHRETAQEFRETLQDPAASASDKEFARRALQEIIGFLAAQKKTSQDPNTRAVKRVHKSIQRLCDNLAGQGPGHSAPDPVARGFAGYIAQHILVPSRRYTVARKGANIRVARGELAGHLVFECSTSHRWAVHV